MPEASQSSGGRLIIVANRLPVTVSVHQGSMELVPSPGGLATGLTRAYEQSGGEWVGWPGETSRLGKSDRSKLERELEARALVPVPLTLQEVRRYYETFANGVIWPLFHYLLDRIPLDPEGWETYTRVNERFADVVASRARGGDVIWVHDYQLMLLPSLLRERLPEARIGFFLHIPFPAPEVFRILPWRERLLEGLLGADLIGFHTAAYVRHFATSLRYLLGVEADVEHARFDGREIRLGAFPMGIDAAQFDALARSEAVRGNAAHVREEALGRRLLIGVDRLDYTKGLPRRMLAFERLLEREPELRDRVRMVQVAVPTRAGLEHYQSFRRGLEETIGRINGAYATLHAAPIHYLHRSISREELVALYCAADVMVVTPIRDGMNLVAKEFVASRVDEDGVLVLSELAGAASELGEALLVNPFDVDGLASAMKRAIEMPRQEQRARMRALRERVADNDVYHWTSRFLEELNRPPAPRDLTPSSDLQRLLSDLAHGEAITLLLDYDGTLVPIVSGPALAAPDEALLAQIAELAATPGIDVQIVSGRARETLESWLGGLPVGMWAEHGLWHRSRPGADWRLTIDPAREWMDRVRPLLLHYVQTTPGTLIEEKTASFAWHYRIADPELGERHARELREDLARQLRDDPVEILEGSKVIEVRLRGVSKGLVVAALAATAKRVVAMGDDRTDEDMFAALPADGIAIHVGPLPTRAHMRLKDWRAARSLLQSLAEQRARLAQA
jgi:trehalose 6-phosphate synthase/phosphatase